jgi:HEAT repeat protein
MLADRVVQSLSVPERVASLEKGLNADPPRPLAGLSGVLARLGPQAVAPLCGVLASLAAEEPRTLLRETLIRLGRGNPEPVLKGLADPRPVYARDLIAVIGAWQLPQAAEVLSMVAQHPAAEVRQDALSSIARLHPSGDAAPLLAFISDQDDEVRQHALRQLASGRYTAGWEGWQAHLSDREAIVELPRAAKRLLFQALRSSAGDAAAPFWQELLGGRGWKQRQKKEETALLAVKSLAALGTPRAREALEFGKKQGNSAVRKACAAELAKGGG